MMDEAKFIFVQEAEELLEQMEDALLSMEDEPDDPEYLNSVFRAAHTIKGSGGIFGYDFVVSFTHPVETELDRVRMGERGLDKELIAWLLECKDHLADLIQFVAQGDEQALPDELVVRGQQLLQRFETSADSDLVVSNSSCVETEPDSELGVDAQLNWLISLDFKKDTYRNGLDPISFIRYLRGLGEIVELVTILRDETLDDKGLDPESCYLSFRIAFLTQVDKPAIAEVFSFAEDDCDIRILPPQSKQQEYIELLNQVPDTQLQPLGEMLRQVGALTQFELEGALSTQQEQQVTADGHMPIGEILIEQQIVDRAVVDEAISRQAETRKQVNKEARSIRVDALKLGELINLVGELVIASASMRSQINRYGIGDADEAASNMERLVGSIRDNALQLRMVPIGETFSRFRRVVRDVSQDLGKEIELQISGGDSELDKSVVEKLNDPLTHLVRNALDHGIEMPCQRKAQGKPAKGTLSLNAYHDSGHIVVEISDDGKGLDLEKIREKAIAQGLIRSEQSLTRQELQRLIFEPGLSTKQEATNLSGRGVGMDVVRRNIEVLRGSVDLDTVPGQGTKVTIRLPLTLAIIDGFMVGVGSESYIVPLSMVEECVEFNQEAWQQDHQGQFINLRGDVLPFIRMHNFFGLPPSKDASSRESLVVVRFGRQRAALVVDALFGEQQTVIKPLGAVFQNLEGVSGATVLGSGEIALILDVQGLVSLATQRASDYRESSIRQPGA